MPPSESAAFSLPILESCQNGECGMCGRCCIAFQVDVPSVRGDALSAPIRKRMGEICPQLIRTDDGRYGCAVHASKESVPLLRICADWDGTGGGYERLVGNMRDIAFTPKDAAQRADILRSLDEGLLCDIDLRIGGTGDLVCALDHYLDGDADIPRALFEAMEIKEYLDAFGALHPGEFLSLMERLSITADSASPSRRAFHAEFVADIEARIGLPEAKN